MKLIEIRDMENTALIERLKEFKREIMNLRFQKASKELQNLSRLRTVKHTIAKILTILNERNKKDNQEVKSV